MKLIIELNSSRVQNPECMHVNKIRKKNSREIKLQKTIKSGRIDR